MTSQSSTRTLADLPAGTRVFIDANIFIYHFTQTPLTAACTAFLQRVEAGSLQGITSVVAVTEVAHRLMILEAIQTHQLVSRTAVRKLKENSALVQKLTHYQRATAAIPTFGVQIEPVTFLHLQTAQKFSETIGLLTNDSLIAAVMQSLSLTDVASNDTDLAAVPGITSWKPQV